ncbi:MAG: hypothetical protein ACR2ME_07875 [Acidimicrobiia bacterium]
MPSQSKNRQTTKLLGVAAAAVAMGLLLGATLLAPNLAGAQESPTTTTADGATSPSAPDNRLAERQTQIRSALDGLVTDGTITSAQADAAAAALASQVPDHGGHSRRVHFGLDVISTTIGITEAELREALEGGQTIAQVAEANGVTAQAVIDALVAAANASADEAVAAGNIDEARAEEIRANATERATDFVNGEWSPSRGPDGRSDSSA